MGLMDRIERGELQATDEFNHRSEEAMLDEILDLAESLMEAIEADGAPPGVVLAHEEEYQRGGRNYIESGFWGLLGLMFIGVPLGMVAMFLLAFLANPSGITPLGLVCLPLLLVLAVGLIWLGKEIVSEPFENLTDPDPVEHVVERTWLDPVNRLIAVFLHATDDESGVEYAPEISTAFFVGDNSKVEVYSVAPHGGADSVTPGYENVHIIGINTSYSIQFAYGRREEADDLGKLISETMQIRLQSK